MTIPIYYDPMLAKLIAHGKDRSEAIERLKRAIDEYEITGVQTTLTFGKWVLEHPDFLSGHFDTGFIPKYFKTYSIQLQPEDAGEKEIVALLGAALAGAGDVTGEPLTGKKALAKSHTKWRKNRLL